MKKGRLAVISLCAVFAFSVMPLATVNAVEAGLKKDKKGVSQASVKQCEKRKAIFAGFDQDLDRFKQNHYLMPTDLSPYPLKTVKFIDGTKKELRQANGNVTIYKNGKAVKAKRVNYALVLQRHEGASAVAAAKGVDVTTYNARIAKLSAWMNTGQRYIDLSKSTWASKNPGSVNCNTKDGQTQAKSLIRTRADLFKSMQSDLKNTKKASGDASKAYTAVAVAYKKKP